MKSFDEGNINTVFLMLGSKCNFKCRYCLQTDTNIEVQTTISGRVINYLKRLKDVSMLEGGSKINIRFWGGEPLLYFETIKDIVSRLGEDFGYSMVSNGLLLSSEVVDYLNERNIYFALSNDGPNTDKIRGLNVLEIESVRDWFTKINNRGLNYILTAHSQDFHEVWDYFMEKKAECYANMEHLICNWDMPSDLYNFDLDLFRKHMDAIAEKAFGDTVDGRYTREVDVMEMNKGKIVKNVADIASAKELSAEDILPRCGQVQYVMNIDLAGNVYSCHNVSTVIGTVDDDYEQIASEYLKIMGIKSETCLACNYLSLCGGGCPLQIDGDGKAMNCEMKKIMIDATIKYILKFGENNVLLPIEHIK